MANEVYAYVVANDLPFTKLECCGFLSYMTDNNRAPNTIIKYAKVSEFFANKPSHVKYEFLPFSHFMLAVEQGKDWRRVLEKSVSLMAGGFGRPPSRARLEYELKLRKDPPGDTSVVLQGVTSTSNGPVMGITAYGMDVPYGSDPLNDLEFLLSELNARLERIRFSYPLVAPLLGQAIILITEALKKTHETKNQTNEAPSEIYIEQAVAVDD